MLQNASVVLNRRTSSAVESMTIANKDLKDPSRIGVDGGDSRMDIFNSREDLRVVVRTPSAAIVDTHVTELEAEGRNGKFVVRSGAEPTMAGLASGEVVLRKRDGGEIRVRVDWGSLVAVGHQVRVVVENASVRYLDPLPIAV